MSNRVQKANSVLQKHIAEIIQNDLNDPRLSGALVTVSNVNISSDLTYAKVSLSIFGGKPELALEAIKNASGYIRKELSKEIKFRALPELAFSLDDSAVYSEKINKMLKKIDYVDSSNYNDDNYYDNDHNNKH